jgi:hypothetical protein
MNNQMKAGSTGIDTTGIPELTIDFKTVLERHSDGLKTVGAGNATGLIVVGALLTSTTLKTTIPFWLIKVSVVAFFAGVLCFAYAYWWLYIWFNIMHELSEKLADLKRGEVPPQQTILDILKRAGVAEGQWKTFGMLSLCGFGGGCFLVAIGILLS